LLKADKKASAGNAIGSQLRDGTNDLISQRRFSRLAMLLSAHNLQSTQAIIALLGD